MKNWLRWTATGEFYVAGRIVVVKIALPAFNLFMDRQAFNDTPAKPGLHDLRLAGRDCTVGKDLSIRDIMQGCHNIARARLGNFI
jgi:hypothetical protein